MCVCVCICVCVCVCGKNTRDRMKVILREDYREGRWEMRKEPKYNARKQHRENPSLCVCVCVCSLRGSLLNYPNFRLSLMPPCQSFPVAITTVAPANDIGFVFICQEI